VLHVINVGEEDVAWVSAEILDDCCLSFGSGVGAFRSEKTTEWKLPRNDRKRLQDGRDYGTKDDFRKVRCGGE